MKTKNKITIPKEKYKHIFGDTRNVFKIIESQINLTPEVAMGLLTLYTTLA